MTCRATAGLLRCCLYLLVNVDTSPCAVSRAMVPGHHWPWRLQRASPVRWFLLQANVAGFAGCCLRAAAQCRGPAGRISGTGTKHCGSASANVQVRCTAQQGAHRGNWPGPVSQPALVRTTGPNAILRQFHAGWLACHAGVVGWDLLT